MQPPNRRSSNEVVHEGVFVSALIPPPSMHHSGTNVEGVPHNPPLEYPPLDSYSDEISHAQVLIRLHSRLAQEVLRTSISYTCI